MKHRRIAEEAALSCLDLLRHEHPVLATDYLPGLTSLIEAAISKGILAEHRYEVQCRMSEGLEW